ncbi:MAG: hypothetical protein E7286_00965 [Lachnospiraceae bacterium]|nr:hypothetical protein [Lachnospiraceae bacterium]
MKRRIRNALIVMLTGILVGVILLLITFSLPVDGARAHVKESLHTITREIYGEDATPLRKHIFEIKDSFTDYLMVQNALEDVEGKNVLEHAMYVYHHDLANETTWLTQESLEAMMERGTEGMYLQEYSKYWHGYLIWLKPMLMLMSWATVENVLVVVQGLMFLAVVFLAFYKKQPLLAVGIPVTFLFMKPLGVWYSFTLTACWGIIMLALLADLLFYEQIQKRKLREVYFLVLGIMTAYFDFLTYPITTLGIPLCFYLVRSLDENNGWWNRLKEIFWSSVSWGVGYIGMWGMKWVIAELTVQSGTLRNAAWSIIYRTEPLDGYVSVFSGSKRTLTAVLQQYDSLFYWILFAVILVAAVISFVWCLVKASNKNWAVTMVCLLGAAALPFAWLILTQNHTAIHCSFTFRIMSVTVIALWCMIVCSVQTIKRTAQRRSVNEFQNENK